MIASVYTIPMCEKENIEKAINRFMKKANAYGKSLTVQYGEPYVKERAIIEKIVDEVNQTVEYKKIGTELVEVFDLTMESEVIRKDGYSVVAKLEHLEEGNFVYAFTDDVSAAWQQAKPVCEHCKTKHFRRNTFVVRHEDGSEKQVGSTCLKDYCGIDPKYFVQLKELYDLIIEDEFERYDFDGMPKAAHVFMIEDAIALAKQVYDSQGYRKSEEPNSNKQALYELVSCREMPSEENREYAKKVVELIKGLKTIDEMFTESEQYKEFDRKRMERIQPKIDEINATTELTDTRFKTLDEWKEWMLYWGLKDDYLWYEDEDGHVVYRGEVYEKWLKSYPYRYSTMKASYLIELRTLAKAGYCKETHLGYIAFAPVAYERYMKALAEDEARIANNAEIAKQSNYVGNVGDKIDLDLKEMSLITSWESDWGWVYLYKMIDVNGNVYVWKSSRKVNTFLKGKAIVKAHSERDGIKQTVVTRCKAIA